MMKLKTLAIMIAATTAAFTACTENDSQQQQMMPITLTSQIATTRSFTPTQENHLVSGQKLYVWANREATEGTANWTQNAYLKAWTLTADGSGALTGSTKYYPPQTLSMVALHGNFSFTEDTDVFPGTVQHSVLTDQSTEENYAKSDLLYWKALGQSAEASKAVTLGHKLSKIEIHLSGNGYTEDDIDQMELTLNNVLPTASLDLTDGTLSQAYGTAVSIKPYKTNKVDYEAIIPPQQKPLDFITVTLNGTVVKIDAQVTGFDENTRYPYNLDMTYRDIRKNPLWYVAEYNVNYDGSSTYSWATTPDEGYFFSWADAVYVARSFSGWHLPTKYEFNSIIPGANTSTTPTSYTESDAAQVNIFNIAETEGTGAIYSNTAHLSFGYNDATAGTNTTYMTEKSYWYKKSSNLVYAIRYCDSEFCSAWKYEWADNGLSADYPATLTITSVLLGTSLSTAEAQSQYGTTESNWTSLFDDLQFVNGNDEAHGAVRRVICSKGYASASGSEPGTNYPGNNGQYWSATSHNADDAYLLAFRKPSTPNVNLQFGTATYGRPIRLFRDKLQAGSVDLSKAASQTNNPLYYMAEYNYNGSGFYTNNNYNSSSYWMCNWYYAYYNRNKTYTISSKNYHIGSNAEWLGVLPQSNPTDITYNNPLEYPETGAVIKNGNRTIPNSISVYITTGNITDSGTDSGAWTIYAVRFIDTDYCSVWKYSRRATSTSTSGGQLTIESFILDKKIRNIVDAKALITALANRTISWPSGSGTIKRQLPAAGSGGNIGSSAVGQNVTTLGSVGDYAYYMTSTELNSTQGKIMRCNYATFYTGGYYEKTYGLPLRLFSN